jgi:hypothetical protein
LCACNFTIPGIASTNDTRDAGMSAPPGTTPPHTDAATPADLAMAADMSTPMMPDLTPPPMPINVGDACAGSCGAGLTCMTWVPDGYCSQSCDSVSNACPAGSSCVDIGNGSRFCLASSSGNCARPDLHCRDCGGDVCAPPSFCGGGC